MSRPGMIEVTGVPLEKLVRAAYEPSRQQGLGIFDMSGQHGGLPDDQVAEIVERGKDDRMLAVSMDYVNGRSCKFSVRRDGERLFINNKWYDHSDNQLRDLLESVGLSRDLVDQARAEQEAYQAESTRQALAFLQSQGGSYQERRGSMKTDPVPLVVRDGLINGLYSDMPCFKEEYEDGVTTYTLLA